MITLRKSKDRGHLQHGWLDTYHSFSFASYYDPAHMGFSVLRVINEDRIQGGAGFATHPHRDMEIITYVVEGELAHKDSMGNSSLIKPGEVQRMSAGTGVEHSEYNSLRDRPTHLLQIWILPNKEGHLPSYGQKSFAKQLEGDDLVLVVSQNGHDGSISIHQDIVLYAAKPKKAGTKMMAADSKRSYWIQLVRGGLKVNGEVLSPGDGAAIKQTKELQLSWGENSEFLIFDLP